MAKFGVLWFPETKASLWQIMILWQSRRCTVCTSNVGSLGNGLYGTHRLHTLCCGMNSGVYGKVWGALVPRNEGVPLADYDFMAVQTLHWSYQQYRRPGSKGYIGTHRLHTLCCGKNSGVFGQVWGTLVPRNEGVPLADYDFTAV